MLQSRGFITFLACQIIKKIGERKNKFGKFCKETCLSDWLKLKKRLIIENCGEIYNETSKPGGSWNWETSTGLWQWHLHQSGTHTWNVRGMGWVRLQQTGIMVVDKLQRTGFKICRETHEEKAEKKREMLEQLNEVGSHLRLQFWKECQCTKSRGKQWGERALTGLAECST